MKCFWFNGKETHFKVKVMHRSYCNWENTSHWYVCCVVNYGSKIRINSDTKWSWIKLQESVADFPDF